MLSLSRSEIFVVHTTVLVITWFLLVFLSGFGDPTDHSDYHLKKMSKHLNRRWIPNCTSWPLLTPETSLLDCEAPNKDLSQLKFTVCNLGTFSSYWNVCIAHSASTRRSLAFEFQRRQRTLLNSFVLLSAFVVVALETSGVEPTMQQHITAHQSAARFSRHSGIHQRK